MTTNQQRAFPEDVFVDRDGRPYTMGGRSQQSESNPLAAFQELSRQNLESNCALYSRHDMSSATTHHDDTVTKSPSSHAEFQFEARTTSPSPPLSERITVDACEQPNMVSPSSLRNNNASLFISTDISPSCPRRSDSLGSQNGRLSTTRHNPSLQHKTSASNLHPIARTPSGKQRFARNIGSAASSTCPSPVIAAMGDVTPLPSPLLSSDSPGPWKRLGARPPSRELALPTIMPDSVLVTKSGESVAAALEHQTKRKAYAGLQVGHAAEHSSGKHEHTRNRSISEYIPDPKGVLKRQNTVSTGKVDGRIREDPGLRREPHLSESRGIISAGNPPTPPPSESSQTNDSSSFKIPSYEYFEARGRKDQKMRRWRGIKELGEGTFSRVVLATNKLSTYNENETDVTEPRSEAHPVPATTSQLDRKSLVAIKVCEHGPKGGASEDRIEMSLKRELEIMQSVHHPSLVHLKAWNIEPTRALLVLSYCPGGDLFDVASNFRESLNAPILRRIFSEIVGAVRYLHERRIVHRDIKLESMSSIVL